MKISFVPIIIKGETGDSSDKNNYRTIVLKGRMQDFSGGDFGYTCRFAACRVKAASRCLRGLGTISNR